MTLYIGRHVIAMNPKRDADYKQIEPTEWEAADPKGELQVEFEIVDMSQMKSEYIKADKRGNGIYDQTLFVKLRKVY